MGKSNIKNNNIELDTILNYIDGSKGLRAQIVDIGRVNITQDVDKKQFSFSINEISEVLNRSDSDGKEFVQVNFKNSQKILITDSLIGFKPSESLGLDMSRIPKVVTTPDLKSVFEAIEEALGGDHVSEQEVEILKKVYFSILTGAEKAGFRLDTEKAWYNRLVASKTISCA